MQIIYEGVDITQSVDIGKAVITDTAGGQADSLDLWFNDPQKLWSQWRPEKGHQVQLRQDGFDSGLMHVDELDQRRGVFIVRALSLSPEAKTERTQGWEQVRFLEFAGELASRHGLQLRTYGITNHLYERLDQREQADFAYLSWRCMLEGYSLKITNSQLVIFSEREMEAQPAVREIHLSELDGEYGFWARSTGIYAAASVRYQSIFYEHRALQTGPVLRVNDLYVSNQAAAERYARGLLREANKHEHTGRCVIRLEPGLAASNMVELQGVGWADGRYYCEQVRHDLVAKKTELRLRRPLEGY